MRKCEVPSPFLQAKYKGQMIPKYFSSLTLGNHQHCPCPWGKQDVLGTEPPRCKVGPPKPTLKCLSEKGRNIQSC